MLGGYLGQIEPPKQGEVPPPAPTSEEVKELNLRLAAQEQYKQYGLLLGAVSVGMKLFGMFKGN